MKKVVIASLVACLLASTLTFPCIIQIENDGGYKNRYMVLGADVASTKGTVSTIKAIHKNKTASFGSHDQRPEIALFMQSKPEGSYKKTFILKMIACAKDRDVVVKISDIINDTYDKNLFHKKEASNAGKILTRIQEASE